MGVEASLVISVWGRTRTLPNNVVGFDESLEEGRGRVKISEKGMDEAPGDDSGL